MANRVRGVRQTVSNNILVGRVNSGGKGPVTQVGINDIVTAIINAGVSPVPGPPGSDFITSVDATPFTVTAGELLLNDGGVDYAKVQDGSSDGLLGVNNGGPPTEVAVGTGLDLTAGVLTATGGGGTTISDTGAWNSANGYTVGQCATYLGSAYLCYVAKAAPTDTPDSWNPSGLPAHMTVVTTTTTDDTALSTSGGGTGDQFAFGVKDQTRGSKLYYEVGLTGLFDAGTQFGAAEATYPFSGGGIAAQFNGTTSSTFSGGSTGSIGALVNGNRAAFALDISGALYWFTPDVTAGSIAWNGSTSNDPGTGVGGIATGSLSGKTLFKWFYGQGHGGQQAIMYTRPADLLIPTVPSGFTVWNSAAGTSNVSPDQDSAHWLSQAGILLTAFIVADLPSVPQGWRAFVTDALAPVFGSTVAGSGAVVIPVFYDGTNWIVG